MAEGDNMESSEKQNGQMNGVDAASKKAAEANGGHLKDNTSLSMGEESDVTIDKGSRRRECIFINLAILLGLALIGVLIYFSVANALQAESPKAVAQQGGTVSKEMTTMTTTTAVPTQGLTDAGFQGKNDPSSLLRNMPGNMRRMPGQLSTTTEPTTKPDFANMDRSKLLRMGPIVGGK